MSKLYFRYGTMGSSKTLNLLAVAHNYEAKSRNVLILKPSIDDRDDVEYVSSRTGLKRKADFVLDKDMPLPYEVNEALFKRNISCVLVDEAQFMCKIIIDELREIANDGFPVICYGLRTDCLKNLFPGSKRLMELADSIEEIKTICSNCDVNKAIFNKYIGDRVDIKGDSVAIIGGEEKFAVTCARCFDVEEDEE